jgi:Flp pilus assembly protein TadG
MRRARGERGQILAVVALALVALLGIGAFAIDVGYAYYAKRQLQSATDAAALAGAQDLPTALTAVSVATTYAQANVPPNLSGLTFTYQTKCTATAIVATGCNAAVNPNALVVTGTATTNTWFAKIFGIDHFDVAAHANACSPCSSTPVDIVVAIDRTGSMCRDENNQSDCGDMNNAKSGVRTMLGILNPPYAQIGLVAFPPLENAASDACDQPYNSNSNGWNGYDAPGRKYVIDTINGNYKDAQGNPVTGSGLYAHMVDGPDLNNSGCITSNGSTSYSEALRQAKAELDAHGRPNVPDYIVFLSDGEANLGSVYPKVNGVEDATYFPGNDDDQKPCHEAEKVADNIKKAGVTIYSIGYALGQKNCTAGQWHEKVTVGKTTTWLPCVPNSSANCQHYQGDPNNPAHLEAGPITSYDTLANIATQSPGHFKNKVNPGDLDAIFASIATDISSGTSRLVDDGY